MTKARDLGNLGSDIGTAATADITTSTTDTTAGRLLKVGDFGLGTSGTFYAADQDCNDYEVTGTYYIGAALNTPVVATAILIVYGGSTSRTAQRLIVPANGKEYFRTQYSDVWTNWKETYNSGSTCENFTSTGIDDNATSTAITINASENVFLANSISTGNNGIISILDATGDISGSIANNSSASHSLGIQADPNDTGASTNIQFYIDGSEKLRIENTGNTNLINGNLVIGTSGKGIDFSAATGSAAGSTSAVLDDYEEGTFTPSLTFGGANVGMVVNSSTTKGSYTKIGNQVTVHLFISLTDKGSSVGVAVIDGLPFTSNFSYSAGAVRHNRIENLGTVLVHITDGQASIAMSTMGLTGTAINMDNDDWNNNSNLMVTMTYRTA